MKFDLYLVGVGGQGVLTIGDVITEAALGSGIPANFYPTKGMAQRGGFVKAQVRLGRAMVGPQIPEKGADLAIAMELSESLRAVRFVRPGGEFAALWARVAAHSRHAGQGALSWPGGRRGTGSGRGDQSFTTLTRRAYRCSMEGPSRPMCTCWALPWA